MSFTIFDIARDELSGDPASITRVLIARHALTIDGFEETYERLLKERDHPHFEMHYHLPFQKRQVAYLTSADVPLEEAFIHIAAFAEQYLSSKSDVPADQVSSVVGAELWAAAHPSDSLFGSPVEPGLHLAPFHGPDSISATAAIIARAAGKPLDPFPLDPEWPALCYSMPYLKEALDDCERWVESLGFSWCQVLADVSRDLGWETGGSRSHDLSLILARLVDSLTWTAA